MSLKLEGNRWASLRALLYKKKATSAAIGTSYCSGLKKKLTEDSARLDYTMETQELRTNMLRIVNNKMLLKLHWQYNGIIGIVEEWSLLQLIKIFAASLYNEF